jgi:phosphoenolpyruvate-protein kinase (PTS system EI component)
MMPMVSNLQEIRLAREIFDRTRADLLALGKPCAAKVQLGIMVEVPSIALVAEQAAPLVDFFSIGTNDLTQYTLAVDRGNERIAKLASAFHPAVLQLIAKTVRAAHQFGKWCGLCGELAGDPLAAPFLLGIGLDEFSASAALIPALKDKLRTLDASACRPLAEACLTLGTPEEVKELLEKA